METDFLLISSDHPPMRGGISRVMEYVCRALGERRMRVLAPADASAVPQSNLRRTPLRLGGTWFQKAYDFALWWAAAREEIRKNKVQKVIIALLSPLGVLGLLIQKTIGIPYYIFAHASEIPAPGGFFLRTLLAKYIYESSACVLCVSQYAMTRVKRIAPGSRCEIIYHGVDSKVFQPKTKNEQLVRQLGLKNKKVFLCLGRLVRRKGYDTALEAFARVLKVWPEAVLILAGEGPDRMFLNECAVSLGVAHAVRFAGFIEDVKLSDVYSLADVFLFLSRDENGDAEGFGLVILEAFACGLPVIGGRSGAIPEVIQEGRTGYVVDPLDSGAAAEKMLELVRNGELRLRFSQAARSYAQEHSWQVFGDRLKGILGEPLGMNANAER